MVIFSFHFQDIAGNRPQEAVLIVKGPEPSRGLVRFFFLSISKYAVAESDGLFS